MDRQSPANHTSPASNHITLFLTGDVMIGRGIDQILPHPSDPVIHESYLTMRGSAAMRNSAAISA